MVEDVEKLASELDGQPFTEGRRLREGHVPLGEAGTAASVTPQVTIFAGRRSGEGSGINLRVPRIARRVGPRERKWLAGQVGANLVRAQEWRRNSDVIR